MQRERRYTVIKHSDVERYLSEDKDKAQLCQIESLISFGRQQDGRGLLRAMVIEADWPEYEPAWRMIERRVDGKRHTMVPLVEVQALADDFLQEYISSCGCKSVEDIGAALLRLLSSTSISLLEAVGQKAAVSTVSSAAKHLAKPQYREIGQRHTAQ